MQLLLHFPAPLLLSGSLNMLKSPTNSKWHELMASGRMSREEALACTGSKHACHVMLYCDTNSCLFGRTHLRHVILMQMRFDGLLGFPGGMVDPSKETLEAGLTRELLEELGLALPISEEHHVEASYAPASSSSSSSLILHFYVKKISEEQIREAELAALSVADHGMEVLGMVRVPLYTLKSGKGLGSFLSQAFVGNARSQLLESILRLNLVAAGKLRQALAHSMESHKRSGDDLRAAFAMVEERVERA